MCESGADAKLCLDPRKRVTQKLKNKCDKLCVLLGYRNLVCSMQESPEKEHVYFKIEMNTDQLFMMQLPCIIFCNCIEMNVVLDSHTASLMSNLNPSNISW